VYTYKCTMHAQTARVKEMSGDGPAQKPAMKSSARRSERSARRSHPAEQQ